MRRAFSALAYPHDSESARGRAAQLAQALDAEGQWRRRAERPGLHIWTWTAAPLAVQALGGDAGFVIGDLYPMPGEPSRASPLHPGEPPAELAETARRVLAAHWGQYVALLGQNGRLALLRDPSGMIDLMTWSLGDGLQVIASDPWRLPAGLRPRRPALNWDRIAAFVTVPTATTTPALLDDIVAVGPGEYCDLGDAARVTPVWSPLSFAADPLSDVDARAAGPHLLARVEHCVSALVGDHASALVELSGGLDSAALAGVIGAVGLAGRVTTWLNLVDVRPEGDESVYAQAVAQRLNVTLTCVRRAPGAVTPEDLAELAGETWPAIAGADAARDRDGAARLTATGATAIVSGQGGDAVFFQMGAPVVAADALAARGWRALTGPILPDLARRTHQSVWGVLRQVAAARHGRLPERKIVNALVAPDVRAWAGRSEHAWTAAALRSDLPLGKRLHVRAIASAQINHQYSRRRRVADLVYPLLAQPVVELALRIPSYVLAGGAYDRPYQRAVFADHIPDAVRQRRAKGSASVYFARLMANSLPALRPYLLEGCLCGAGVLDRATLEAVMTPEHLIWKDTANDLIAALATEAWVRHWQTRVPDSPAAGRR